MQSSYRVIKNNYVQSQGNKEISTKFEKPQDKEELEENLKNSFESYENLVNTMLENARRQSEKILSNAYEEAQFMDNDAKLKAEQLLQEAYSRGYEEGRIKGYQDAYDENLPKAQEQCETIRQQAEDVLWNAKKVYELYLDEKKHEIKDFILDTVQSVLKQAVKSEDSIAEMIFSAIEEIKNAKSFIIKCHSMYMDNLKSKTDAWKGQLAFKVDIFILKDDSLELGTAVIDKGNGKVVVSINYALEKLNELLEGDE